MARDSMSGDRFGISVDISGTHAVIGATGNDAGGIDRGAAYIFRKNTSSNRFTQLDKINPTGGDANDYDGFGRAVSIDGTRVLVGANGDDENGQNAGAAYFFEKSVGDT